MLLVVCQNILPKLVNKLCKILDCSVSSQKWCVRGEGAAAVTAMHSKLREIGLIKSYDQNIGFLSIKIGKNNKIIRRAPPVLRATKRSVRQRQTFVGARGVAKRRTTIERAMVIIDAAKQTERIHHVPVPGHRRRRWCSAQDVVAWLRKVKNIKISLKTVQADIRVLKEKTL